MVSVLCPICNASVLGEGELDLSVNLRAHMQEVHRFTDLCDLGKPCPGPAVRDRWSEPPRREPSPRSYEQEAISEWHGLPEERPPGEDIPQSLRCPICGYVVKGYASDDLSYNLAWHFSRGHDIKVKLTGKG